MSDVLDLLFKVCVVLDVNAVGHNNVRNVACLVDVVCVYGDFDFSPVFHRFILII